MRVGSGEIINRINLPLNKQTQLPPDIYRVRVWIKASIEWIKEFLSRGAQNG
jgi:hypothetical protein